MAGKRDIKLDTVTHDIIIEDSDFSMVSEGDWLLQSVKIKLLSSLIVTGKPLQHFG